MACVLVVVLGGAWLAEPVRAAETGDAVEPDSAVFYDEVEVADVYYGPRLTRQLDVEEYDDCKSHFLHSTCIPRNVVLGASLTHCF